MDIQYSRIKWGQVMNLRHTKITPTEQANEYAVEMFFSDSELSPIHSVEQCEPMLHLVAHVRVEGVRYPSLAELQEFAVTSMQDELQSQSREILAAARRG